ncbi:MAG: hypothetical protein M1820_003151 [Bogoriella megaspora]|nr:MAG: hypothetical protein M1820_003151 [Bogoriella megaspora]
MASITTQIDRLQIVNVQQLKTRSRNLSPQDAERMPRPVPSPASSKVSATRASVPANFSRRSPVPSTRPYYVTTISGEYSFETVPTLTKTPWELSRSKQRSSQKCEQARNSESSERLPAYGSIWVPLSDQPVQPKKLVFKSTNRLKLLRRTLVKRPHIADRVRELKISVQDRPCLEIATKDKDSAFEILVSIVVACPNLERLVGFTPTYGHIADSLVTALHKATRLKEHAWVIGPKTLTPAQTIIQGNVPPGLPSRLQNTTFVRRHMGWFYLEKLVLHSNGGTFGDKDTIALIIPKLPSLKSLSISNFGPQDFGDSTIENLPALQSLRLENLPGLSDHGTYTLSSPRILRFIQSLTIINIGFVSCPVISRLLANAPYLTRFTLIQHSLPELPFGAAYSQPFFASPHLDFLHWDILSPGPGTSLLAESIQARGFPFLRSIRAPTDTEGILQSVCRPRADIALPGDLDNSPSPLTFSSSDKDLSEKDAIAEEIRRARSLPAARLAAQNRLKDARNKPQAKIVVEDEGELKSCHTIKGFMGTLGSRIEYVLEPDVPGSEEAIVDVGGLLRGRERLGSRWCEGLVRGGVNGKKDRGVHSARRKEKDVGLRSLF